MKIFHLSALPWKTPNILNWMQLQMANKINQNLNIFIISDLFIVTVKWGYRRKVHLRKSLIPMLQPCPCVSVLTGHEVIIWGWKSFLPNSSLILCRSRRCLPGINFLCYLINGLIINTIVFQADSVCIQVQDLCSFLSLFIFSSNLHACTSQFYQVLNLLPSCAIAENCEN